MSDFDDPGTESDDISTWSCGCRKLSAHKKSVVILEVFCWTKSYKLVSCIVYTGMLLSFFLCLEFRGSLVNLEHFPVRLLLVCFCF